MGGSNALTFQLFMNIISVAIYKVLEQILQSGAHVNISSQTCRNFSEWLWHGQDKVIKGSRNLITARRRSLRRLCFHTCLSVILFTGGCLPQCILGYTPPPRADTPWGADTPPATDTPRSSACWEIRATSGRYASYWNAYLLLANFSQKTA